MLKNFRQNLKILQVIPSLKKGGAERLAIDIAKALKKQKGIECKLVSLSSANEYKYLLNSNNVDVVPARYIPSIRGNGIEEIENIKQYIYTFQPDIIHSHLFEAELISRVVNYQKAVYFSHCHDNMPPFKNLSIRTFTKKELFLRYYEKRSLLKLYRKTGGNHFIAISKDTYSYFHENLPTDLGNISFLPNAIDVNSFKLKGVKKPPGSEVNLVTVGSLVDNKNHVFLLKVVRLLRDKSMNVKLDIVGDGPNLNLIQKKIQEEKLQDYIKLHGKVDRVEQILWENHIYVHSAINEAFGLVLLEAMAAGLPVVTLDGKGNRDLIDEGNNGFMIHEPNANEFAEKVFLLYQDRSLYQRISRKAVFTAQQYGIDSYVEKLIELYQKALLKRKNIFCES